MYIDMSIPPNFTNRRNIMSKISLRLLKVKTIALFAFTVLLSSNMTLGQNSNPVPGTIGIHA
jgi:hypothetical protein